MHVDVWNIYLYIYIYSIFGLNLCMVIVGNKYSIYIASWGMDIPTREVEIRITSFYYHPTSKQGVMLR